MGLHVSEINSLGTLSREGTRRLAKSLKNAAEKYGRLDGEVIEYTLGRYRQAAPDLTEGLLNAAGWLEECPPGTMRGVYYPTVRMSEFALDVAQATISPRMSFNAACCMIKSVVKRLDAVEDGTINGITLNRVFLFGSSLRDENSHEKIGDLDLGVDVGFDESYSGMPGKKRMETAEAHWKHIVTRGKDRIHMSNAEELAQFAVERDRPEKPFVVAEIWRNPNMSRSSLMQEDLQCLHAFQKRACTKQARARAVVAAVARVSRNIPAV